MADKLISRAEALAQGLKHYFTGKRCPRNHVCLRRVIASSCVQCDLEKRRAWRQANLERERQKDRDKVAKLNPEEKKNLYKSKYCSNSEAIKARSRQYYVANREKVKAKRRAKYKEEYTDPAVRKEAYRRSRIWALSNPERMKAHRRNNKAKRKAAEGTHTESDILEILRLQKNRCAYCREKLKKYHIDHILALARGGTNFRRNLQIACEPCNLAKGAKDPIDFARSLGRLL